MRNFLLQIILFATLAFLVGCDFRVNEGNVQDKIQMLEKTFRISWPTNCTKMYGATLSAGGRISDIVVRLEMTETIFLEWRHSTTNELKEYQLFPPAADPKLEKRFPWWDCAKHPEDRVTAFFNDARTGNDNGGNVGAFVVETNGTYIMYIHGSPMR